MNLFIDTISPRNVLILFNEKREIINKYYFDVKFNETTLLIEEIDNFLKLNGVLYLDLQNIVVVNGPGSFTGIRTVVLLVNTINFVTKKNITSLTYFDLFTNYPIIKSSSKKDSFLKMSNNDTIEVLSNFDIQKKLENIKLVYGDIDFLKNIEIINYIDYQKIINNIVFDLKKNIEPFYIKKPSIS